MNLKKLFTKKRVVKVDRCEGCCWRELKRFQKCSTCRRNQKMKDNYEPWRDAE